MDLKADPQGTLPDQWLEQQSLREGLDAALKSLKPRERAILRLRFGLTSDHKEHTLDEVGKAWSLTRERIRQIEARALAKLKRLPQAARLQTLGRATL